MAALDFPAWDVAALLGDGLPRIYTVERLDAKREAAMLERAREWWERYIAGDERPPFDDSAVAAQWLARTYPDDNRPSVREATEKEARLLEAHVAVRAALARLNEAREAQEVEIKAAIADAEGLRWGDGFQFTWRRASDSTGTNWEDMAIALMCNFLKDVDERAKLIEQYAIVKPGVRRVYVKHPALKQDRR